MAEINQSVVSPIAETTIATGPSTPCMATVSMILTNLSGLPTEEPPNFITV